MTMKYTHATLLLDETGAEINERNLTAVLEAADAEFTTSRVKAVVAALEGVDVGEYAATAPDDGVTDTEDAAAAETNGTHAPDAGGNVDLPATDGGESAAGDREPSGPDGPIEGE